MPEFNATLVLVFISFFIFMLLMKGIYFDPMLRIKQERERKLLDDQASAREFAERFAKVDAEYSEALQKARKQAHQHILEARLAAKATARENLQKAQAAAQAEMDRQMSELAEWREATYRQLESERESLVHVMISKVTSGDKIRAAFGG